MNESRREKVLNLIGLGLLALCFVLSLGHIFGRYLRPAEATGKTTIRFAHWQLESGLREAFDRISAAYMQLHPDVRVEQMPVPTQIWANWLRTQLIGGTAPELIEIEGYQGETNEMLANYFEPVTPCLGLPNPYNKDNDLAGVPWRDTFIDGLSHSYNQELLQNTASRAACSPSAFSTNGPCGARSSGGDAAAHLRGNGGLLPPRRRVPRCERPAGDPHRWRGGQRAAPDPAAFLQPDATAVLLLGAAG